LLLHDQSVQTSCGSADRLMLARPPSSAKANEAKVAATLLAHRRRWLRRFVSHPDGVVAAAFSRCRGYRTCCASGSAQRLCTRFQKAA
jgi:hypothetical protein